MKTIHEKLKHIQNGLVATKDKTNKFGGFNYRNIEDLFKNLKPHLVKYNCTLITEEDIIFFGERYYIKSTAILTCIDSGECIKASSVAREQVTKKGMEEAQVTGGCVSYARKYAVSGLFAIDNSKDTVNIKDIDSQSQKEVQKKKTPQEIEDEKIVIDLKKLFADKLITKDQGLELYALKNKDIKAWRAKAKELIVPPSKPITEDKTGVCGNFIQEIEDSKDLITNEKNWMLIDDKFKAIDKTDKKALSKLLDEISNLVDEEN